MKKTNTLGYKFASAASLAVLGAMCAFTSCSNDFDFEEAKRQNPEYAFKEAFEQAYGAIDPDQSWDFTDGGKSYGTRATETFNPAGAWSSDYYNVHESTINYINQNIAPETSNNIDKGIKFQLVMPNNDWEIIPIYQGQSSSTTLELHLVTDEDYTIWSRNQNIEYATTDWWGNLSWNTLSGNTANTDKRDRVRAKKLTVSHNCFDPGTEISFYTHVINGSYTRYPWGSSERNAQYKYKRYYSTSGPIPFDTTRPDKNHGNRDNDYKDYDKPYIIYLKDMPELPVENVGSTPVNGVNVKNEAMLIACEGGGDTDINDIVFLIIGKPYAPKTRPLEGFEITSKRYMIEDLGATTASDIDFNDVVIDLVKTQYVKKTLNGTQEDVSKRIVGTPHYKAYVRALGGTKNVAVYLGDGTGDLFAPAAGDICIYAKDKHGVQPGVTVAYNTAFAGNTNLSGGLEATVMYNTNRPTTDRDGDGKYVTMGNNGIIATIDLDQLTGENAKFQWNPSLNNIYVKVYDQSSAPTTNLQVTEGATITFPEAGAIPAMIAVKAQELSCELKTTDPTVPTGSWKTTETIGENTVYALWSWSTATNAGGQEWNHETVSVFPKTGEQTRPAGRKLQLVRGN